MATLGPTSGSLALSIRGFRCSRRPRPRELEAGELTAMFDEKGVAYDKTKLLA